MRFGLAPSQAVAQWLVAKLKLLTVAGAALE